MHNVPTDFRIIMNPASLVSSISFYRLSFELQLMRNDTVIVFCLSFELLVTPRHNTKAGIMPRVYYKFLVYWSIYIDKRFAGIDNF